MFRRQLDLNRQILSWIMWRHQQPREAFSEETRLSKICSQECKFCTNSDNFTFMTQDWQKDKPKPYLSNLTMSSRLAQPYQTLHNHAQYFPQTKTNFLQYTCHDIDITNMTKDYTKHVNKTQDIHIRTKNRSFCKSQWLSHFIGTVKYTTYLLITTQLVCPSFGK